MELQRAARAALFCASRTTTTSISSTTCFRLPIASLAPFARPLARQRQFSTTLLYRAPPRSPAERSPSHSGNTTTTTPSWPPNRSSTGQPQLTPGDAAPSADPLRDLYAADNPAQWALLSGDDFYKRHMADGGVGDGLASSSSSSSARNVPRLVLKPVTGRTVFVGGHVDLARAFQRLNVMVRGSGVQADFRRQRFHERPGLKRKRLRSERWRERFKRGFRATVQRVRELTRQGW
ncbi:Ribosomal protein S21 [Niveomyces insectorum RCEF 264]|uniref:Ribosomal protein S21 n=1 Tax=Niveomyces insectorum RCEF 264 TaxID=1081102 RepID=A0A167YXG0_9HYPO|nr:Ribosomal protein S21 [Niveomyces insectorum RCEF 264]